MTPFCELSANARTTLLILLLCLDVLITPFTPAFAYFRSGTATDTMYHFLPPFSKASMP